MGTKTGAKSALAVDVIKQATDLGSRLVVSQLVEVEVLDEVCRVSKVIRLLTWRAHRLLQRRSRGDVVRGRRDTHPSWTQRKPRRIGRKREQPVEPDDQLSRPLHPLSLRRTPRRRTEAILIVV